MAIFSKRKSADKGKDKVAEPEKPRDRTPYVPKYAQRDGLIGAPAGVREDEQEAFKRAYAARLSRENSEMSFRGSMMSPKMSPRMSRNSSSMSLDYGMPSSSSRHSNPFASGRSSFQSLPHLMHDDPPVPAIPDQYASQASSVAGAQTPLSHSRNSSFHSPQNQFQQAPSYTYQSRPRGPVRSATLTAPSPLGRTPEASHEVSPVDSINHSSASSTASSSSGEIMEIQTKHDSPAQYMIDRAYPNDPRAFGAAPHMDIQEQTPRKYFGHAAGSANAAAAAAIAAPAPVAQKKRRFGIMRRSQAVAAH